MPFALRMPETPSSFFLWMIQHVFNDAIQQIAEQQMSAGD